MIYLETAQGIKSEDGETPAALMQMTVDSTNLLTVEQFLYRKPVTLQSFSKYLPLSSTKIHQTTEIMVKAGSPLPWFSLLEMYSTCLLTNEQDKFTAISGIAKLCSQKTNSPYLAGIWTDRLTTGLMWMNVGAPLKKPSSPRAPSWSWAAYDGPIQFPLADKSVPYTSNCKLIYPIGVNATRLNGSQALTIQVDLLDLSAEIMSGDLIISLYREELRPESSRAWDTDERTLWRIDQDPPIRLFNLFNAHRFLWTRGGPCVGSDRSWITFDTENGFLKQSDYRMPLFCALLATFTTFENKQRMLLHMVLFLVPVESPNTYRRVGAGIMRHLSLFGGRARPQEITIV